jgi:putative membrane-bound dehydrogenase-like protein
MFLSLLGLLVAVPPLSPTEERATFRLPSGIRIDLVASEPEVVDPVAMAFDASGRLYVAEMPGYPNGGLGTGEPTRKGRIKRLEDRDGDGVFETSIVFADDLRFPTGVFPWRDGVLVGDAPNLLFVGDSDGDGHAEIRKRLYTGFGNRNIQQMINSLQFHVDGWVYGCNGANESEIRSLEISGPPVPLRGRHFRFHPDKPGSLEALSGGGQYGLSPNEEGVWFTSTNAEHIKEITFEDRYLRNNPRISGPPVVVQASDHDAAAKVFRISPFEEWRLERTTRRAADKANRRFPATELVPGGYVTSGCGTLIYRGGALPAKYHGSAFVCDPANNLIHRDVLNPTGVLFKAVRGHTDCEFLASTDRWFRPVFLVVGPDGCLYVADFYREIIETPLSLPEDIQKKSNLASRERGRIWRISPDQQTKERQPPLKDASNTELVKTLGDANSWRRLTAQRLLIERHAIDLDTIQRLFALAATTGEPIACKHAIATLKGLGQAVNAPLAVAIEEGSPMLQEEALRLAEPLAPQPEAVKEAAFGLAKWSAPRVRFQLACSLGGCDDPRTASALEAILRQDVKDVWLQAAILSAASGPIAEGLLERLALDASIPSEVIAKLIASVSDGSPILLQLRDRCVRQSLSDSRNWPMTIALLERLNLKKGAVETGSADDSVVALARHAASEAGDADKSLAYRLEAIRILASTSVDATATYKELLTPGSPPELQLAAIRSAVKIPSGPALIVESWRSLSPAVKTEAIEALLSRPAGAAALVDGATSKRIPNHDLTPHRKRLAGHSNPKIRELATRNLGESPSRTAVLKKYQPAATQSASPERGKLVFQKHCAVCHRLSNEGPQVGPDLRAVLANKTKESLLVDLLDPNRDVDPRYVNYLAVLQDGRTATGLIAAETTTSVTLRRSGGFDETILRTDIDRLTSTGTSVMPEGLEQSIGVQDAADLVSFLLTQR